MKVDFRRLTWENFPSTETPINADNLNRLEEGVAGLYSDVAEIEQELGGGVGEYVTDWLNEHVDPVGSAVVVDDTLSIEGAAADAKKTGDEISSLKEDLSDMDDRVTALEEGGSGSGLTDDIKQALLQIARKVAYIDEHGQTYYNDLYNTLYAVTAIRLDAHSIMLTSIGSTQQLTATTTPVGGTVTWVSSDTSIATVSNTGLVTSVGYGSCTITASSGSVSASCAVAVSQVTLTSISADYQQSGTVYDTASLDSLKNDLTVTATYSDSSTATVTEYTLSGTLTAGTSTITVDYGGKTTTFTVTVTAAPTLSGISAVYTQDGTVYDTDTLDSLKADLVVTAHYSDSTTQTVTEYTLSGTLTEGTSIITVSYGGKTATFNVTVSEASPLYQLPEMGPTLISNNYTGQLSDVDEISVSNTNVTTGKSGYFNSDGTITISASGATWFELHTGDEWEMRLEDISYTNDTANNKFTVALKTNSGTTKLSSGDQMIAETGSGTLSNVVAQGTISEDTGNLNLLVYLHRKMSINFKFRFYVNGVWYA